MEGIESNENKDSLKLQDAVLKYFVVKKPFPISFICS